MKRAIASAASVLLTLVCLGRTANGAVGRSAEQSLTLSQISDDPVTVTPPAGPGERFTWWLPPDAEDYVLPLSGGVLVEASRPDLMSWLRQGAPWPLVELPALGARYGDRQVVVVIPWPHYAELVVEDRLGVRFSFPPGRHDATPCAIVIVRRQTDLLEVARVFREWRENAGDTGAIPRPLRLADKARNNQRVTRLFGAPHFYLWGPALFSRHDVADEGWLGFARALEQARDGSIGHRILSLFTDDQRRVLGELTTAQWPQRYLTSVVAAALDEVLADRRLLDLGEEVGDVAVMGRNKQALGEAFAAFVRPASSWGDGLSTTLLQSLHGAGVQRAVLLLSDLYGGSLRPDVAAVAERLGYLLGPYDSYHSVHAPDAHPDSTWETAQFDSAAYDHGRIQNRDGTGHRGFGGRGYHFSPSAAWPYVQDRVGGILNRLPYSTWFIDCDAAGEYFDDYHPQRGATRVDDVDWRRKRLTWLASRHDLIVGSEGGSALFADVIHFGHGSHTPYLGHLEPSFRDPDSPHYLGGHWPPDSPKRFFDAVPLPQSLKTPYFDPAVRIPLYQAALGDEVIATHHWVFDSLKLADQQASRELMAILYGVPPLYHVNRESWPKRREHILRHLVFWGPLHRQLATAPLARFEWLSEDRLVQRTAFEHAQGEVTITVNFGDRYQAGYPAHSATVVGPIEVANRVFRR